ncbi:MAG TPA: metal-dependent phosphohydrolase [Actinokineospora sp.]|jgi:predicted metal-dependent HD superfamily phosphohydrolase|nr:metal-dependent phosphohydrolase [Actinokineospora sp.]
MDLFARLGLPASMGEELLARWSEPHRTYHGVAHLRAVLRHVDTLAAHADAPDLVRLAAWFHDAVHAGLPDDEEQSALLAVMWLSDAGLDSASVDEVARLVRLTAGHATEAGDRNGEVLCDADLAILASPEYWEYAASVRAEYAHVPDELFRPGRAAILRSLLELPALYRTPQALAEWEERARANLNAELADLELR